MNITIDKHLLPYVYISAAGRETCQGGGGVG